MAETIDDWKLLDSYARGGSHEAFGQLVAKYADFVLAIARRRVRDIQLAEDVTQSVFIVLARRAGGLRGGGSLAAWLHQTTLLAAANAIRSENRRLAREKAAVEIAKNSSANAPGPDDAPLDLDDALEQISRGDRDVLSLHYLEDRPVIQTAQILGISVEAAKKRLARAWRGCGGNYRAAWRQLRRRFPTRWATSANRCPAHRRSTGQTFWPAEAMAARLPLLGR